MYKPSMEIITLCILIITFSSIFSAQEVEAGYHFELGERVLTRGDEGPDVALLQRKLKELSFYEGHIDGLYGAKTVRAVRDFQRKSNITGDGITGRETIANLPQKTLLSRISVDRDEIILLARIIHGEARGESFKGKVAVGAVILNRVESNRFPDTIREVILQEGQFSCLNDGQANYYPFTSSIEAAKAVIMGYDPTFEALYFYNPQVATKVKWISQRSVTTRIGEHVFAG